jgi:putative membrane protein
MRNPKAAVVKNVAVVKRNKSLAKGLVAGLIGGLAGMAAKRFAERMFPPQVHREAESRLVESFAGHELAGPQTAAQGIHWALGGAAGAVYGGLAEFYPAATAKQGASFGLVLGTLTEEGALAGLGTVAAPEDQTIRERTSGMTSYAVYGVVTETVRRLVRWVL